jgi:hypothetical protein
VVESLWIDVCVVYAARTDRTFPQAAESFPDVGTDMNGTKNFNLVRIANIYGKRRVSSLADPEKSESCHENNLFSAPGVSAMDTDPRGPDAFL